MVQFDLFVNNELVHHYKSAGNFDPHHKFLAEKIWDSVPDLDREDVLRVDRIMYRLGNVGDMEVWKGDLETMKSKWKTFQQA